MDAEKCYWCGQDIGNGNLETREGRLLYFCSLLHIKRWTMNSPKANDNSYANEMKVFVAGKFIGQLKDFVIN